MTDAVLVTGAFGLVGSSTVKRLAADGRRVVATDLDVPANRRAAAKLPPGVEVQYADLTDPDSLVAAFDAVLGRDDLQPPIVCMPVLAQAISAWWTQRWLRRHEAATGHRLLIEDVWSWQRRRSSYRQALDPRP